MKLRNWIGRTGPFVKILFDNGTPAPLRRFLVGHLVDTTAERGWATLANGSLLDRAEEFGYELLITTDQSMQYQQNLVPRPVAVLVLLSTAWPLIQLRVDDILATVNEMGAGDFREFPV